MTEEEKLELVKSRFEHIEEDDHMDGDEFFAPPPMAVENKLAPSREAGQLQRKSSHIRALALQQGIRDQITQDLEIVDLLDTSVEIKHVFGQK